MKSVPSFLSVASFTSFLSVASLHRYEAVEPHMGTLVRITLYAPGEQAAREAFRAGFDRIRGLDAAFSDYRSDSELNRLAAAPAGRPVRVSEDLFAVLAVSQEIAAASDGAFDVTQGPIVRLWREARKAGAPPDAAALRQAAARTGFRKLRLDAANRTATLDAGGMALDLGGIGKGYAASAALDVLAGRGISRALVAVSGDLAFGDAPPGRRGWRIGMPAGETPDASLPPVLELTHAAVSTSGAGAQHLEADGRRYSHIVDPASGVGLTDDISVTVIAARGAWADGLGTAVSVLGPARGLALVDSRPDAAAVLVRRAPDGTATVLPSARFCELAGRYAAPREQPRPPVPDTPP